MLFNSYPFLLWYLPIVISGFFGLSKLRLIQGAKIWLFASSLFFYAYWNVNYLPLLIGSILFNYFIGTRILLTESFLTKKAFLFFGITANLALLFYFKYSNFFLSHFLAEERIAEVILPLGISFFTFTQIAYLIDAYYAKTEPCNLISYGLFVTIFPHQIAGPILHHRDMIKQFDNLRMYIVSWPNIAQGTCLFVLGLSKKVIIADSLAKLANPIFDNMTDLVPFVQAWFGALAYTLQLYFDFSGYSDMAVGIALLFSLRLPINFNSPYQADSIIDFWRRWHITLSNFLRDYLYIPLGGSRNGRIAKLRNLFITMLLGGLWHGAGWTFILWGVCHGCFLIINHLWRDLKISMPRYLAKLITLLAVVCAWVVFRSPDVGQAINILKGMSGFNGIIFPESYEKILGFLMTYGVQFSSLEDSKFRLADILTIGILILGVIALPNSNYWSERLKKRPKIWAAFYSVLFFICFTKLSEIADFLYYQF